MEQGPAEQGEGRERLSLDRGWAFALGHAANPTLDFEFTRDRSLVKAGEARGAAGKGFDDAKWRRVDVPHDWAFELPFDARGDKEVAEHGFRAIGPNHPEHSVGWYRRRFTVPASDLGRRVRIVFDGVFRDSIVWVNGHRIGRHESGYTGFSYDVTDVLKYGEENVLVVRADATQWEGWWYEGAGIYRHVWLLKTCPVHVAEHGTFVVSEVAGDLATVRAETMVENDGDADVAASVFSTFHGPGGTSYTAAAEAVRVPAGERVAIAQAVTVPDPMLWSCEAPNLYKLRTEVHVGGATVDTYDTTFGIRTLAWDAERGFLLNGQVVKIKGTCNHPQHAGVGTAMPDALHIWRLAKLRELGSNAYRCSHYMAPAELLDECDRTGMLVLAENRRAGSSPEVLGQLRDLIVRDRNHPSIIAWSLANEEHTLQWDIAGERVGRAMVKLCHKLDPTRAVTSAMHDRGLNEGFANVVDVHGWNYMNVGDLSAFHARRPGQPILGTEEGSTVCTRGEYADDKPRGYVSAYDRRAPKWGSTAEAWWTFFAGRDWLAGGFLWIGFDHFGEPIPYQWPCVTSHFGLMDVCGFEKDLFFYYQAWWSDRPVLHLFPHWDWAGREGQPIDVWCFSNCDEVELFLNGTSLGRRAMARNAHLAWQAFYEPGTLRAVGYRGGAAILQAERQTTGEPVGLRVTVDRLSIDGDGEDVAVCAVTAVDGQGRILPTANHRLCVAVEGAARLIGLGNGDPSSHEADKGPFRRLFNGYAMALVQARAEAAGEAKVTVTSDGLTTAELTLDVRAAAMRPSA
jgi:beta-galactosidase